MTKKLTLNDIYKSNHLAGLKEMLEYFEKEDEKRRMLEASYRIEKQFDAWIKEEITVLGTENKPKSS